VRAHGAAVILQVFGGEGRMLCPRQSFGSLKTASATSHPSAQLLGGLVFEKRLNLRGDSFVHVDNLCAHTAVCHVHDSELALERLILVQLATEIENLAHLEISCANEQQAVVAHILDDTREVLSAGIDCPSLGHRNPQ
jgi:hypothetical protein